MYPRTSHTTVQHASQPWRRRVCIGAVALVCVCGPRRTCANTSGTHQLCRFLRHLPPQTQWRLRRQVLAWLLPTVPQCSTPMGLRVVWAQGDLVSRTTLVLLILMSLLSWYVIVAKLLSQRQQAAQAQSAAWLAFAKPTHWAAERRRLQRAVRSA
jgi:hypothetical protein